MIAFVEPFVQLRMIGVKTFLMSTNAKQNQSGPVLARKNPKNLALGVFLAHSPAALVENRCVQETELALDATERP